MSDNLNNTCINKTLTGIPPKHNSSICLKADTGASKTYVRPMDKDILQQRATIKNGPKVQIPNGVSMTTTETGILPLHQNLSTQAQSGNVINGLNNASLLSIGQLCDDNCVAVFDKRFLRIFKNGTLVVKGLRNWTDELWDVTIATQQQKMNMIIRKDKTKMELAEYLHKCAFSPSLSTFQRAIRKGHLINWPGIADINFEKYITNLTPTAKGHLDQERSNLQSTRDKNKNTLDVDFEPNDGNSTKTFENTAVLYRFDPKEKTYSDQTGRFPHRSSRGNEYLMIMYDHDSNAILVEALKNRQAKTLADAWKKLNDRLTQHGHVTKNFVLDNECSAELKTALRKHNKQYELTPPNVHRRNAAERAIRTFKNHLMAGFATCDKEFPVAEWDRLLVQAELTLNLLRTSRVNPKLSAYAYLFGNFDFNRTPLAPPGTKVIIHKKSKERGSWDYHGVEGWYIGPSLQHYRCIKCYNPDTFSEVDTDTVQLIPHKTPIPVYTDVDAIKQAISDILHILKNPAKSNIPTVLRGDSIKEAFKTVADLLGNNISTKTTTQQSAPTFSAPTPNPIKVATPSPRVEQRQPLPQVETTQPLPRVEQKQQQPRVKIPKLPPLILEHLQTPSNIPTWPPNIPRLVTPDLPWQQTHNKSNTQPRFVPRAPFPRMNFGGIHPLAYNPQWVVNHIFGEDGKKLGIDDLLRGPMATTWRKSTSNELARLSDGIPNRVRGTKAVRWIRKHEVPKGKKVTYANMVCDYRPLKDEKYRVRLTIGGDKLDYDNETASPTANLLDTKILLNNIISDADKNAKFMTIDIKDCFLMSPLPPGEREYMRIHSKYFDKEIRDLYNLHDKINQDGYIYCEILLGVYGLKQAAILAYKLIRKRLKPAGYYPINESNGLWRHKTRKTIFALCVDDFGIKYHSKEDAQHLIDALSTHYDITIDWTGRTYCGLTLDWNYKEGYVDVSMPGYVVDALQQFQHTKPTRMQHTPHKWNQPAYGQRIQYADADKSKKLDKNGKRNIQSIVGKFLFYGRAVETPILTALNDIGTQQSEPTQNTQKEAAWLMDFLAWHPEAKIRYYAGNMQLAVDSDAAYLVAPGAKSRYAGHFYLESKPHKTNYNKAPHNGAVHTECKLLRNIVCSAAEAECGGLFHNAQVALGIRRTLEAIGHSQQPTKIKTDNTTANSFVHASMRIKRSKTWDMRYHWLREQTTRNVLRIFWDKGTNNNADYHTKHHSPAVHKTQRPRYILKGFSVNQIIRAILDKQNFLARVCSTST